MLRYKLPAELKSTETMPKFKIALKKCLQIQVQQKADRMLLEDANKLRGVSHAPTKKTPQSCHRQRWSLLPNYLK